MASIKNLKSKGRANSLLRDYVYALRKQQYADSAPAKIMRPVRLLKAHYKHLLTSWSAAVSAGKGLSSYPWVAERALVRAKLRSGFDSLTAQREARALC